MEVADRLLKGSIDMHMHAAPDPERARSVDALEAARQAREAGMRAIVLKSHSYPTAPLAYIVNQMVPGISVFGSICLDFAVGGLNTDALEASAKLGARVVWMPTLSSAHDMGRKTPPQEGVHVCDRQGKLLPVLDSLLEIVRSHGMVLATGHISPAESFALVARAKQAGIWKIMITHPLLEPMGCHLTLEEQRRMAAMGAFIEHCFLDAMLPDLLTPERIVEAVKAVGAEHCIITTDLGMASQPPPAKGMEMAIAALLDCGLTEREIELMVIVNPARLLDLV